MSYKIIVDSCGELTDEMKRSGLFESISLNIELEGEIIKDDESFDQMDFLKKTAASAQSPKSSCPSPKEYMDSYLCDARRIYVVTLSGNISGSYNSAELGKRLYNEEYGEKDIYIFNSRSASVGETLIAMKIRECEECGLSFEKVVESVEKYVGEQNTYFVLETLDTLRKNGRLTGLKAIVASALNIKPIMGATRDGIICQLGQARGMRRAIGKMIDNIVGDLKNPGQKTLAIAHCNCRERALDIERAILERVKIKASFIVDMAGITTMYANDGGIVVVI